MLARKYSLKTKSDFDLVKLQGVKHASDTFTLVSFNRKDQEHPRFGFIVSTKVSKNASLRNRAKRSLSEGVRRAVFSLKPGYDFVFLAKPNIIKKYTSDVMKEVDEAFIKHNFYEK